MPSFLLRLAAFKALACLALAGLVLPPVDITGPDGDPVVSGGVVSPRYSLPAAAGDEEPALFAAPRHSLLFTWGANTSATTGALRYSLTTSFSRYEGERPCDSGSSVEVGLATYGTVPALGRQEPFDVRARCNESLVGLVTWEFAFYGADGADDYAAISVHFLWQCARRNCSAECFRHGVCDYELGVCNCSEGYHGENCSLFFDLPLEMCQSVLPMKVEYALPENTNEYAWWALIDMNTIQHVDWRYFATGSMLLPVRGQYTTPLKGYISFVLGVDPGPYKFVVVGNEGLSLVIATWIMTVLTPDKCGINKTTCISENDCSCTEAQPQAATCINGKCKCSAARFWYDCSHGCGPDPYYLYDMSGKIQSDEGAHSINDSLMGNFDTCSWYVTPPKGTYNKIRIRFEWIDLGEGDLIHIYDTETQAEIKISPQDEGAVQPITVGGLGFQLVFQTGPTINSRGFWLHYEAYFQKKDESTVVITSIVVGGVASVAAVITIVYLLWVAKKYNAVAEYPRARKWSLEEEREDVASFLPRDMPIILNKNAFDFGLDPTGACPIDQELQDEIVIKNTSKYSVEFTVFIPDGDQAFELDVRPGTGRVKPGLSVSLRAKFKLLFTTRLKRSIKISFSWASLSQPSFTLLDLNIEGAISDRLDPAEISLDKSPIGAGAFGSVYKGLYRGRVMAVKVMRDQHALTPDQVNAFNREIDLYRRLRSPYVVEFVGASLVPGKVCLCVELMENGNLEYLLARERISLDLQYRYAINIAEALFFLHSNNVIHRDVKPSNILVVSTDLSARVHCKLSDFGTAKNVRDCREMFYHTCKGTPLYMAPEMLGHSDYNNKVDVFSFAITLWRMFTCEIPWPEMAIWDVPTAIYRGHRPAIPDSCPTEYGDLICICWAQSPRDRPEFSAILDRLKKMTGIEFKVVQRRFVIQDVIPSKDKVKLRRSVLDDTFLDGTGTLPPPQQKQQEPTAPQIDEAKRKSKAIPGAGKPDKRQLLINDSINGDTEVPSMSQRRRSTGSKGFDTTDSTGTPPPIAPDQPLLQKEKRRSGYGGL